MVSTETQGTLEFVGGPITTAATWLDPVDDLHAVRIDWRNETATTACGRRLQFDDPRIEDGPFTRDFQGQ